MHVAGVHLGQRADGVEHVPGVRDVAHDGRVEELAVALAVAGAVVGDDADPRRREPPGEGHEHARRLHARPAEPVHQHSGGSRAGTLREVLRPPERQPAHARLERPDPHGPRPARAAHAAASTVRTDAVAGTCSSSTSKAVPVARRNPIQPTRNPAAATTVTPT